MYKARRLGKHKHGMSGSFSVNYTHSLERACLGDTNKETDMNNERLQEIKGIAHQKHIIGSLEIDVLLDYIRDLITSYENQGELLQLSLANVDRLNKELAEVDNTRKYWLDKSEDKTIIIADLRKQLAECKEAVEHWKFESQYLK